MSKYKTLGRAWDLYHGPDNLIAFIEQQSPLLAPKQMASLIIEEWLPNHFDIDNNVDEFSASYQTGFDKGYEEGYGDGLVYGDRYDEGYDEGYTDAERAHQKSKEQ